MVRDLTLGLVAAIVADSLSSTVTAGSTTTVVKVAAGQAELWAIGDKANVTGTGATAANSGLVRTVIATSAGATTITLDSALPVAPAVGDALKGGLKEWLRYLSATSVGVYEWGFMPSPTDALVAASPLDRHVVAMYGAPSSHEESLGRNIHAYSFDLYGLDAEWLQATVDRFRARLHRMPSRVTVSAHRIWRLEVTEAPLPLRQDRLRTSPLAVEAVVSRKAA